MNWINLRTELLRSAEFANAKPGAIETWLRVLAYCCEQENGGCLEKSASWTDRAWMTTCGVTRAEVENASPLIQSDGVDLWITGYPSDKENEVKSNREAGRKGGSAKTQAKTQAARDNGRLGGRPKTDTSTEKNHTEEPKRETHITQAQEPNNPSENPTEGEGEGEGELERKENGNGKYPPKPPPEPAPATPPLGADILPTSEEAKAVADLFGRRHSTQWSDREIRKFKSCRKRGALTLDTMSVIAAYYASERAKGDDGRHRRDLGTFLNNFDGELDRAKAFGANGHQNRHKTGIPLTDNQKPKIWDPLKK